MTEYQKRNCKIEFNLTFTEYDGSQSCDFSINGDTYHFLLSYALGDLFGGLLDCVYGLGIEVLDDKENPAIKYEDNDPERENVITRIVASTCWEGEGPSLEWTLSRELDNNPDNIIDISLDFDYGARICQYKVKLDELCYAVARAITNVLYHSGFCGYHYSAIYDSIDIVHFLVVKKIGLTGIIDNFCKPDENMQIPVSSFAEEIDLIRLKL